ncbi:MAG: O-methyltransferase [Hyphomonas sp.]|nr:O-methyltransferase [Hyphomonas sp.]
MQLAETFAQMDAFLERSLLRPDPVLQAIAENSAKAGLVPHAVTPLQAEFLALLIRISGARRVLEIGCLGGYSAVAMARALPDGGSLLTTEIDTRTARVAQANIDQSGFGERIDLQIGPAMEALERAHAAGAVFDFVFIDADKVNHRNYLEKALQMARPGTLIVADNIVRGGDVLDAQSRENSVLGVRQMFAYAETLDGVEMTALQTVGAKGYDGMALFRVSQ